MKRQAELHSKPLGLTDIKASKQSTFLTQTTLKDHYRVVKPRSDLTELMSSKVDRRAGKAVTVGEEVESPSVLGSPLHAQAVPTIGTRFAPVAHGACSSPPWSFTCSLGPISATTQVDDGSLQQTQHTPAASKCGISISAVNDDSGATDDETSTHPTFRLQPSSKDATAFDTPKLFLNGPLTGMPPAAAVVLLSSTRSSSRMQSTMKPTAAALHVDRAVSIVRQPPLLQNAATPTASASTGTCHALLAAASMQGSTGSLRSWLPVACSFGIGKAADSSLDDDCTDDAFSREPTAAVVADVSIDAAEQAVPGLTGDWAAATCVDKDPRFSLDDLVCGPDSADTASQLDQWQLSSSSIKLATNSATVEYQSRYQELLYGMTYVEESITSDDCYYCEE